MKALRDPDLLLGEGLDAIRAQFKVPAGFPPAVDAAAAQAAGVLRDDVSPRWLSQACYGLLVAARDALRAGDVPRRDLDAVVSSFFLHGASAPGKPVQ